MSRCKKLGVYQYGNERFFATDCIKPKGATNSSLGRFDTYEEAVQVRVDNELEHKYLPVKEFEGSDQELIKELFYFKEGFLYRKKRCQGGYELDQPLVKSPNNQGYQTITVRCKSYKVHRLAWFFERGEWLNNDQHIDHINGIRSDNRIENLRIVTQRENSRNLSRLPTNTSGITGVAWEGRRSGWIAYINNDNGEQERLYTKDFLEACCWRKSKEIKYNYHENHGRTVRENFGNSTRQEF